MKTNVYSGLLVIVHNYLFALKINIDVNYANRRFCIKLVSPHCRYYFLDYLRSRIIPLFYYIERSLYLALVIHLDNVKYESIPPDIEPCSTTRKHLCFHYRETHRYRIYFSIS